MFYKMEEKMDTNQKENVIEINNLVKRYKMYNRKKDRLVEAIIPRINRHTDFLAVNNLNLTVKKGEILGILGKNGAGKSTLLKMITGVVTPTQGELKVNGKISSLLELGAAFNMELTGEENIYQHGQVMGLSKEEIERTKQDVIKFADIGDHLYQPVKTYSSGMFARLAFACAINFDPAFGLDYSFRYNMNGGSLTIHFMPYNNGTAIDMHYTVVQAFGARYQKHADDVLIFVNAALGAQAQPINISINEFLAYETGVPSAPLNAAPQPQQVAQPVQQTAQSAPQAKFCMNCGAPIAPNTAFCTNCGKKLNG